MLFRKAVLLAIAVLVSCSGVAYLYLSKNSAPTHANLIKAELSPLIPVSAFYADTDAQWQYRPSFDGQYIANFASSFGKQLVEITDRVTGKLVTKIEADKLDSFHWNSHDNAIMIYADDRLWKVQINQPKRKNWIDVTPRGFDNWRTQSEPNNGDELVVVGSRDRNPKFMDLYTIRQDGGGKKLLIENEGQTLYWILDKQNIPMMRVDRSENDSSKLLIRLSPESSNWQTLLDIDARDTFYIIDKFEFGKPLLAISNINRDKIALVEFNPQTATETVLLEHDSVDLGTFHRFDRSLDHGSRTVDLVIRYDGYQDMMPLTERGETFKKLALGLGNRVDVESVNTSRDGRFATVTLSPDEQSYQNFVFDLDNGTSQLISDFSFRKKHGHNLATTKPVSFKAQDGLDIPALLTLPNGTSGKNLPTLVHIHGGPASHKVWQYDHFKQFLANRGYAVLDVNFRGSTGYGKAYSAAGYGQVGRSMQSDITDAANWLVSEGIADQDAMAVIGASYGGYSSALAMTRDAGTFKAGIVEIAVTDVVYQMDNNPFSWGLSLDAMRRYFGDSKLEADREIMRQNSPINHVQTTQGPILLLHGKLDPVVGFEQSEEFERAFLNAGKDVKAYYFEKEGHGYRRWQSRVVRARMIENFLAEHLGGRNGNYDWAETAAEYF